MKTNPVVALLVAATISSSLGLAQSNPSSPGAGGAETEFRAPDGSFTCRVPSGWKARSAAIGATPVHVLEPEGGEERILVASGPAAAGTIQELAQQAMALVAQQLMPGLLPSGAPSYSQSGDGPVAEIGYTGMAGVGPVTWWQGILLKDRTYFTVLGGGRADRAEIVERQCRSVFRSLRPAKIQPGTGATAGAAAAGNSQLAAAIAGTWSFYDRSGLTRGSVSKQVTFHPNGRFEYVASTFIPNLPSGVDPTTPASGTYRLAGNTLTAQFDNGQQATFTLQLVQGGGLSINGELFIRER